MPRPRSRPSVITEQQKVLPAQQYIPHQSHQEQNQALQPPPNNCSDVNLPYHFDYGQKQNNGLTDETLQQIQSQQHHINVNANMNKNSNSISNNSNLDKDTVSDVNYCNSNVNSASANVCTDSVENTAVNNTVENRDLQEQLSTSTNIRGIYFI